MEKTRLEELCKEITKKVVQEELSRDAEYEKMCELEYRARLEREEIAHKQAIEEMRIQYPLYKTQPYTFYTERFGQRRIYPFRKDTTFTKPIAEEMRAQFK